MPPASNEAVAADPPDVAVVDIRMPPTFTDEGLRAAIGTATGSPGVGILVFSQYVETRYAAELLAGGAAGIGYLLKDRVADVTDFVEALVRVASGGTALDPEVVTQLMGASRRTDTLAGLSAREREVLALMAEGRTNSAIADQPRHLGGGGGEARGQHLLQARPAGHRPPITAGCWRCCATSRDNGRSPTLTSALLQNPLRSSYCLPPTG